MKSLRFLFRKNPPPDRAGLKAEYYIVGLGNPGRRYAHTRHNAGFDVIEELARRHGIGIRARRFSALCGGGVIAGRKTALVLPQTYMNESGRSVRELMDFYKAPAGNIIVVYDDADLPSGRIRVRARGGAGTHNGMRSVIAHLRTEDFVRVRVGIGGPRYEGDMINHVLGAYTEEDYRLAETAFRKAADAVEAILRDGVEPAAAAFNGT